MPYEDSAGPTAERIAHAGEFHTLAGRSKADRRYVMHDSPLGRAWMRQKLSAEEYYSLRRYALHWLAGGLQGGLQTLDLDRVFATNPMDLTGLSKTERQQLHRDTYHAARLQIGRRPALVADHVACAGYTLSDVGLMLGYQSEAHGRKAAGEILADAGYRLAAHWKTKGP